MLAKTFLYPDRERGVGLVEAMISVAILAIAVLGIGMIIAGSYHTITATELAINQQQQGMYAEAYGTALPVAQTVPLVIIVPSGSGGNPLVTVANPVSLIPVDNLLTLSIGAGTGATSSTESVQYGVIRSGINQWWIP